MVEVGIDPAGDDPLDVGEVEHHAAVVKLLGLDGDDGVAVVPMQVAALAVVVEQAMAVAEVDFSGDAEHGGRGEWLVVSCEW